MAESFNEAASAPNSLQTVGPAHICTWKTHESEYISHVGPVDMSAYMRHTLDSLHTVGPADRSACMQRVGMNTCHTLALWVMSAYKKHMGVRT